MDESILKLVSDLEKGSIYPYALVQWAIREIESGKDSPELLRLAGLTKHDLTEALELFKDVLNQQGLSYPTKFQLQLYKAILIAKEIDEERIETKKGCSLIGEICQELDWPEELAEFGQLSHEQSEHETIGFIEESLILDIRQAAKKLVSRSKVVQFYE